MKKILFAFLVVTGLSVKGHCAVNASNTVGGLSCNNTVSTSSVVGCPNVPTNVILNVNTVYDVEIETGTGIAGDWCAVYDSASANGFTFGTFQAGTNAAPLVAFVQAGTTYPAKDPITTARNIANNRIMINKSSSSVWCRVTFKN